MALAAALCAVPTSAQEGRVRIGLTVGGIGLAGVSVEVMDGSRGYEATLSTFSFKDVSVAVAAKQYFGGGSLKPFVGGGLWLIAGPAPDDVEDGRAGIGAILHLPVGLDWRVSGQHYAGLALNVNRALGVRRPDPEDDLPVQTHLVPLPAVYYRYRR